jgi:hypothetical protein
VTLMLLLSTPFWTQALLRTFHDAGTQAAMHKVLMWLSPLALVALPFEGIDLATLPRMYGIMNGPLVPYPPGAWAVVVGYGVLAGVLFGLGRVAEEVRVEREPSESVAE